eukprot:CAMPEP_0171718258 /NCGR_PEP_ID=MMETSP0991-20121206/20514_1 /TAXON_ID=483369 /ORGANISM="non described non described, Strain CCMP2098" /LENGTH=430 /DNA_ID=CAMNT_0012309617 /DNA_START=245 /DNA_END=1537 /DNA_ORIENTATION=-
MEVPRLDDDGYVVATADCPRPPHPFTLIASSKHPGRFFFHNSETKESHWHLKPWWPDEEAALPPRSEEHVHQDLATRAPAQLTPEGLRVVEGLGVGGYGVVVLAEHGDHRYAMKCVCKQRSSQAQDKKHLRRELQTLTELQESPFLMRCHLAFESSSTVFFLTDLISGGDLFFHLDFVSMAGNDGFSESVARILIAETAAGLCHMHDHNLVHRDIKVENVMLSSDGHVKLVDYGLCCEISEVDGALVTPMGSLNYMAPELLLDSIAGRFTDWWALGVFSHELLTGNSPWSTLDDKVQIKKEIVSLVMEPPLAGMSMQASQFVVGLMRKDKTVRLGTPNSREVLEHVFFTSALDMKALELGKTPAAGVPGLVSGAPAPLYRESFEGEEARENDLMTDRAEAVEEYRKLDPCLSAEADWSLGLPFVEQHPQL